MTVAATAKARERVHAACAAMVADDLVMGSAGNISMRLDRHRFVVTAAGVPYGALSPADHPIVDSRDGSWEGPKRPSSELSLHLAVLEAMPEVEAIVHTHSRYAAAFAVARVDLPFICNESMYARAEQVRVTRYALPGTTDLGAEALRTFHEQPGSRAVLLANHGVVAIGDDLDGAYMVARAVEWTAEICHHARRLGGEHVLDPAVQDAIGRNYGIDIAHPTTPRTDPATGP